MWLGLVSSLLSVVIGLRWSFEIVLVVTVGWQGDYVCYLFVHFQTRNGPMMHVGARFVVSSLDLMV